MLGKVKAHVISTEQQKRGMSHLHCLLILDKDTQGLGTAEFVDDLISAEIPDYPSDQSTPAARQQKRLYDQVVKYNLHDCNEWCLVNQKCNKRFPKEFAFETSMSRKRQPLSLASL